METLEETYRKILRYCAYRERCPDEVRMKLKQLGIPATESAAVLERLEAENFLNEERFARAYIRGKFRMNGWGRIKIRNGLSAKGVASALVSQALREEIDPEQYQERLQRILSEKGPKTALSRGFEPELVRESANTREREETDSD